MLVGLFRGPFSGRNRFGSIRFGSVVFEIGSVRFGKLDFPVRRGSACAFSGASWLGPIRFGSVPRSVPAGSEIRRFCSVRFGRFGSASYSFLLFRVATPL